MVGITRSKVIFFSPKNFRIGFFEIPIQKLPFAEQNLGYSLSNLAVFSLRRSNWNVKAVNLQPPYRWEKEVVESAKTLVGNGGSPISYVGLLEGKLQF